MLPWLQMNCMYGYQQLTCIYNRLQPWEMANKPHVQIDPQYMLIQVADKLATSKEAMITNT